MVRTRNSVNNVVSMGKSLKLRTSGGSCCPGSSGTSSPSQASTSKSKKNYSGGNPVCPRETPEWQKKITCFFETINEEQRPDEDRTTDELSQKETDTQVEPSRGDQQN